MKEMSARCRRKNILLFVVVVANFSGLLDASANNLNGLGVNKFQSAVQQQNIHTILGSIEERLRNLDNVYSMQLSQSIDVKLDQYHRKLENVESKIMRLEALVMLNLGKISENISTKNFKDDIETTNTYRKLDSIYESVMHRFNYIERQYESNFAKMQGNSEITMKRLEKMEESISKRNSDFEMELSDAIFAIDDLKTTYTAMERKVLNATDAALNVSKDVFGLLSKANIDTRKSMNRLHDNIIGNLQYIDNKTTEHIKISDNTNTILKQMQVDLKEDFNNYANKVADMNSEIWKTGDTADEDLRTIANVVNSTKIELQNGVRSLMVQIGKISQKENDIPLATQRYEEIETKWDENFDKILTNQNIFLESCHRLQMDEPQIESVISDMLNKLIDMIENKSKDMRNLEKAVKNHDARINRNLFQANQNIMSLFEKSTENAQLVTKEIEKVASNLDTLYSLVQSTANTKELKMMQEKLNNLSNHHVHKEIHKFANEISHIINVINSTMNYCVDKNEISKIFDMITMKNSSENIQKNNSDIDKDIKQAVLNVFGYPPKSQPTQNNTENVPRKLKCKKLRDVVDVRAGTVEICEEETRKPRRKKKKYDIDIRSDSDLHDYGSDIEEEFASTTSNVDDSGGNTNYENVSTDVYTSTTTESPHEIALEAENNQNINSSEAT